MELNELLHCPLCLLRAEWELLKDSAYTQEQQPSSWAETIPSLLIALYWVSQKKTLSV